MFSFFGFGKKRRSSRKKMSKRVAKPPARLLKICKKYHIKTTKKVGGKRVYKPAKVLAKMCLKKRKMMMKKHKKVTKRKGRKVRKTRSRFGFGSQESINKKLAELCDETGMYAPKSVVTEFKHNLKEINRLSGGFHQPGSSFPMMVSSSKPGSSKPMMVPMMVSSSKPGSSYPMNGSSSKPGSSYPMNGSSSKIMPIPMIMNGSSKPMMVSSSKPGSSYPMMVSSSKPMMVSSSKPMMVSSSNPMVMPKVNGSSKFGKRRSGRKVNKAEAMKAFRSFYKRHYASSRSARFGNGGNPPLNASMGYEFCPSGMGGVLGANSTGLFPSPCTNMKSSFGMRRRPTAIGRRHMTAAPVRRRRSPAAAPVRRRRSAAMGRRRRSPAAEPVRRRRRRSTVGLVRRRPVVRRY